MSRRGVVEVQFNWIFILIVGVVILIFFVGLSRWYQDNEERQTASELMTKLQTIMTGAQVSDSTASKIDVPRMELEFYCDPGECNDEGCSSSFRFSGTDIERSTSMEITFSPNSIESDFIYTWSLEWNAPYKVSNFLYLTSPSVKYILVYSSSEPDSKKLAKQVHSRMSENKFISLKLVDADSTAEGLDKIQYNHEYLIRFVMFYVPTGVISMSPSMKDGKWDVIYVFGDSDKGVIKFPKLVGTNYEPDDSKAYPYVGIPSLIGAVYSEDFEHYACNMKKAFIRLRSVNDVYKVRTEMLHSKYLGDKRCEYYYDSAVTASFEEIAGEVSLLDFPDTAKFLADFSASGTSIKNANSGTIIKTCPRIY
jgi:hypothetical protein